MSAKEDRNPETATSSSIKEKKIKRPSNLHQYKYIAVRQCDSLKAPAIFFAWEDCFFYIDQEENEGKVEYKGFCFILDAVEWIETANYPAKAPASRKRSAKKASLQQRLQVVSKIQKLQPLQVSVVANKIGTAIHAALQGTKTSSPRLENNTTTSAPSQMNKDDTNAETKTSKDTSKSMQMSASGEAASSDTTISDESETNGTIGVATYNYMQARVPLVSKTQVLFPPFNQRTHGPFHPMMDFPGQRPFPPYAVQPQQLPYPPFSVPYPIPCKVGDPAMSGQRTSTTAPKTTVPAIPPTKTATARSSQEEVDRLAGLSHTGRSKSKTSELICDEWEKKWQGYRKENGGATNLTQEQVDSLTKDLIFDEWVKKWQAYKSRHSKDPTKSTDDELKSWIKHQRVKRKKLDNGGVTNLTQEQVDRLTELGFPWRAGIKAPKDRLIAQPWDQTLADLLAYKNKHGHMRVPYNYPRLGKWVSIQRFQYKQFLQGNKTILTREKVAKLTDLPILDLFSLPAVLQDTKTSIPPLGKRKKTTTAAPTG